MCFPWTSTKFINQEINESIIVKLALRMLFFRFAQNFTKSCNRYRIMLSVMIIVPCMHAKHFLIFCIQFTISDAIKVCFKRFVFTAIIGIACQSTVFNECLSFNPISCKITMPTVPNMNSLTKVFQ